jgi:hypothetical protein
MGKFRGELESCVEQSSLNYEIFGFSIAYVRKEIMAFVERFAWEKGFVRYVLATSS